jgi:tetratricopeptide (TPR) repeat protein
MHRSRTLLLVAGVLAAALPAAAQTAAPTFDAWRVAIERHAAGELDDAVTEVAAWPEAALGGLLDQFDLAVPAAERPLLLRRAIVLHTDLLVRLREPAGYALPGATEDRSVGLVADGVQVGVKSGTTHWQFARALVERLRGSAVDSSATENDIRLWYRATTAFLQTWEDWNEATVHLDRAKRLFAGDPVLSMYEGTIREAYASPRIQSLEPPQQLEAAEPVHFHTGSVFGLARIQRSGGGVVWVFDPPDIELERAEELYRKALAQDPDLVEARIRLGRVLGMRGQHAAAVAELRRSLTQAPPPLLEYWALLFLGRELRAAGDPSAAAEAYERAVALDPSVQAPRLGLSQLAYDRGDRAGALEQFQLGFLPGSKRSAFDPRLAYDHGHAPSSDALLAEWRERVLR